jgi:oxalate decarboxylase
MGDEGVTATIKRSGHSVSLLDGEVVEENDFGSIRRVTADNFPILAGMSITRIVISPAAMRTPHWHANCNELTYCVAGSSLVSVLDNGSRFASFTISAGEMFHVDSGSLHHIENIGSVPAEFIIVFRHERPEDFGLGAVLGNTYDLDAADFAALRRDTVDRKLAGRVGDPVIPSTAGFGDPPKFAVEAMNPPVAIPGSATVKTARMTVMDPDGSLDTWYLNRGDVYFVPRAYPHHIEVVDAPDLHFAIFFDQPTPGDIGYKASASAYSREVLAASFNVHIEDLPDFPFTASDSLVVTRNNPLDARGVGE